MFEPRLALASLSGEGDARWALAAADHAGAAFLGGIAIDEPSRAAARDLVDRDREEFLPADPLAFVDEQLAAVAGSPAAIRPGINVRSTSVEPIREVAAICADHDAILEINAHCRQPELCDVGCGETLLADTERLAEYVAAAAEHAPAVSVKVRAEVDGVDSHQRSQSGSRPPVPTPSTLTRWIPRPSSPMSPRRQTSSSLPTTRCEIGGASASTSSTGPTRSASGGQADAPTGRL
ncbi:MAG: hypothetical protein A07HN63_01119 [uncultured archaeon A07HN63]|nr:MAG: hypothetical protein A07HN63_01119 [uncultured archaeon A07HN63]